MTKIIESKKSKNDTDFNHKFEIIFIINNND